MSWGTCYNGSNNIHFDYPPIMHDGRNYASWQPGSKFNEMIKQKANITSNWRYRNFLTKNADKIIMANKISSCDECGTCPYVNNKKQTSNKPYVFNTSLDKSQPHGYKDSDLKNLYLSKQDLENRLRSPIINQEDYLKKGIQNYN